MRKIELLAPARDSQTAIAAIRCGADAVYMGPERFGAREAAGNSLDAIRQVVEFARPYYVRVYATINTLLFDNELPEAEKLIHQLYETGIDGLIIQDMGLLELDLPPVPLIASTQMDNSTPEKVSFLERIGFSRVILARELSLDQICRIRANTSVELEYFIHGALCVGASGLCSMSQALGGRSGNRGQCAQPCRRLYQLYDREGKIIARDRHLLSIKDLNLTDYLEELIDAGVDCFKIEGRLKDLDYVANVVGHYRRQLDAILPGKNLTRASSGTTQLHFEPDPARSFNRGFTHYGIRGKVTRMGATLSPKSMGQLTGKVGKVQPDSFMLEGAVEMHNGDGICFFDPQSQLMGTTVNRVAGQTIFPRSMAGIRKGLEIYRNSDRLFSKTLQTDPADRRVGLSITLSDSPDGVQLKGVDEDGNETIINVPLTKEPAQKPEAAAETTARQLAKLGNTIFACTEVKIQTGQCYFFAVSVLNGMKRDLAEAALHTRLKNRPRLIGGGLQNSIPYPEKKLDYRGNVLNEKARAFYLRHGVETIEPAAETGVNLKGKRVMTTRYCLRLELGICPGVGSPTTPEPLFLEDEDGRQFRVEFRCGACGMDLYWI